MKQTLYAIVLGLLICSLIIGGVILLVMCLEKFNLAKFILGGMVLVGLSYKIGKIFMEEYKNQRR